MCDLVLDETEFTDLLHEKLELPGDVDVLSVAMVSGGFLDVTCFRLARLGQPMLSVKKSGNVHWLAVTDDGLMSVKNLFEEQAFDQVKVEPVHSLRIYGDYVALYDHDNYRIMLDVASTQPSQILIEEPDSDSCIEKFMYDLLDEEESDLHTYQALRAMVDTWILPGG